MNEGLEPELRELGADVAFPPTPDLRGAVTARLLAPPPRRWSVPWRVPRAVALALAATLLLVATAAALVLVLPGLRLTTVPVLPSAEPLATRLALGRPIAPDTVDAGIPAALGSPDEAYVFGDHRVLSLVYAADADLSDMAGSGIGLLVQVIDGALDREQVEKLVAEVGTTVTRVEVDGETGYWIEGQPHLIRYADADGNERSQRTRLVGNTLVWERDRALYRVESGLGLEGTLRIAESIAP